MARVRSPGYPSIPLAEAIDLVRKLFERNRHNVIDREAAAKDMGFGGITGQSAKMLADLAHYGLIEKAGKGEMRVAAIAARILHPTDPQERRHALQEAAYTPELFHTVREQFKDGFASSNALHSYFVRHGFGQAALQPAIKAYLETYALLQQENASESHRQDRWDQQESVPQDEGSAGGRDLVPVRNEPPQPPLPPAYLERAPARSGVEPMIGERVVFVEEGEASQYLKLIASGSINADMLEALEDFVKRQKRRLERGASQLSAAEESQI